MSAKQIRIFGSKRQKAALRAKRNGGARHRRRTKPNPPRRRAAAPKRRKRVAVAKRSTVKRRKNPTPMILSWAAGNPAHRRKNTVAKSRKRKRVAVARRSNAGRRRPKMTHHRRRTHRNPSAIGNPMQWVTGGAGVLAGVVGARAIPDRKSVV